MKRIALCLFTLITVLVPGSLSQTKSYDRGAETAGVRVLKMSWTGADYDPGPFISDMGSFEIHVKNTGSKTIRAINWDYILIDSVREQVYDHLKFRTDDKTIKQGETKKLIKTFEYRYDPPDYIRAIVRIMRVEYEDGSVWTRSSETGNTSPSQKPTPLAQIQPNVSLVQLLWTGAEAERRGVLNKLSSYFQPEDEDQAEYIKGVFRGILFLSIHNDSRKVINEIGWSFILFTGTSDLPAGMKIFRETNLVIQPGSNKTIYENCATYEPLDKNWKSLALVSYVKFSDGTSWHLSKSAGAGQLRELITKGVARITDEGMPWSSHLQLIQDHLEEIKRSLIEEYK